MSLVPLRLFARLFFAVALGLPVALGALFGCGLFLLVRIENDVLGFFEDFFDGRCFLFLAVIRIGNLGALRRLAAGEFLGLGLLGGTRYIDADGDDDLGMKRDPDRMDAEGLNWTLKHDLAAGDVVQQ